MAHTHGLSSARPIASPLVHGHSHSPRYLSPAQAEARLRADLDRIYRSVAQEESRETLLELSALAVPVLRGALERSRSYLEPEDYTQTYATIVLEELKHIGREPEIFSDSLIMSQLYHCEEVIWQLSMRLPPKLRREFLRAESR